ncbi:hypothetical protein [Streptomyces sp. TRM68367]|uniref:hypothetical protein n=1 Tax=Streptomyces sp. TRM68367 TaxID=2758415 RepID=UPI001CA996C9|nr:hypothetical protein [Streptomyces sp. TRM68367]
MIKVQPTRALRVDFARWAVAQTPKVRTCSITEFAVPPHLFVHIPEELLIGSLVDGHRYVSPTEDEAAPWLTAVPGEPLPPVPDSAYGPDAVPLPEPEHAAATDPATVQAAEDAAAQPVPDAAAGGDSSAPPLDAEPFGAGPWPCDVCSRDFDTRRGRDMHHRMAHREG